MNEMKLRGKIAENGISISELAKSLGINRATIFRKFENGGSFTRKELQVIRHRLQLSDDEFLSIFFYD